MGKRPAETTYKYLKTLAGIEPMPISVVFGKCDRKKYIIKQTKCLLNAVTDLFISLALLQTVFHRVKRVDHVVLVAAAPDVVADASEFLINLKTYSINYYFYLGHSSETQPGIFLLY